MTQGRRTLLLKVDQREKRYKTSKEGKLKIPQRNKTPDTSENEFLYKALIYGCEKCALVYEKMKFKSTPGTKTEYF